MKNFILTFLILCSTQTFADDFMFFSVESFSMDRTNPDYVLYGPIVGREMDLKLGTEYIQIKPPAGDLFEAESFIENDRIVFRQGPISFSTPLGDLSGLKDLSGFSLVDAEFEMSEKQILINALETGFTLQGFEFNIDSGEIWCDPQGQFNSDIEGVCMTRSTIRPTSRLESSSTTLKIKSQDVQELNIEMKLKELNLHKDKIQILGDLFQGTYKGNNFVMKRAKGYCAKNPDLTKLDPIKLIEGCLNEADVSISHASFVGDTMDGYFHKSIFNITKTSFKINADGAVFKADNNSTGLTNVGFDCFKENFDDIQIEANRILNGCLKRANFTIDRLKVTEKEIRKLLLDEAPELLKDFKGLIDVDDLKKVSLAVKDGEFSLKGKMKIIFRIGLKISGRADYNEKKKLLNVQVKKASIMGITAKKLALMFIKKFISSENIKIEGDNIIVKL